MSTNLNTKAGWSVANADNIASTLGYQNDKHFQAELTIFIREAVQPAIKPELLVSVATNHFRDIDPPLARAPKKPIIYKGQTITFD